MFPAVGVVLLLVAGGWYVLHRPGSTPAAAPARSAAAPPSLDHAALQALLTTADTTLAAAFQAVAAATTPLELQAATRALRDTLAAQVSALPPGTPLVRALTALQAEAEHTSAAATSLAICGSASALPALTGVPAADAVRTAAKDLRTEGYTFGTFLPAATSVQTRQAGNGTYTGNSPRGGQGRLTVTNGGPTDAVLSLAPAGTTAAAFAVYVRAGGTATVTGVKDGSYDAFEASGVDWDGTGFTRGCAFQRFDNPTTFKTSKGTYTRWTITLGAGAAGGQPLSAVDPGALPS